jgi:hypothetical protein
VITTPMLPQSDEFWKLFDWVCDFRTLRTRMI